MAVLDHDHDRDLSYSSPGDHNWSLKFLIAIIYWPANCTATISISCGRVSAGIQAMSCQHSSPTVVCYRRMSAGGNGGGEMWPA